MRELESVSLFERILVPLDHSEHSQRALDVAIQIAKKFGGKITLIHVYSIVVTPVIIHEASSVTSGFPIVNPEYASKLSDSAREAAKRVLEKGKRRAKAENVEVNSLLKEGHTVQEIVRASKEDNFGLIVMGARGVSRIREMLLGSVTDGVMHHTNCPVLVIR